MQPSLGFQQRRERDGERRTRARIAPATVAHSKMKAAGLRRDPYFPVGQMPVDNDLAAVFTFDLEDPLVQVPVDIDVRFGKRGIERHADRREHAIGGGHEFAVGGHRGKPLRARIPLDVT